MNERVASLDVTRAVAMIGVVALNFHGYLNVKQWTNPIDPSIWESAFHPVTGILTTRFAATFVFIAGIGVALFLRSSLTDRVALQHKRLVLFRRGVFLFGLGLVLQWIWPGTIIFYYGAYFMLAALMAVWRTRTLVISIAVITLTAAAINGWQLDRQRQGFSTSWLSPPLNSPRNLLIRTFVDYTHPLLPWMAFLLAGVVFGRHLHHLIEIRRRMLVVGLVTLVMAHLLRTLLWPGILLERSDVIARAIVSTDPYDRSLLYTMSALATAVVAFTIVSYLVDSRPDSLIVERLATVGTLSLSIYVLHVLLFNLVVDWFGLVEEGSLVTALGLALVFYVPIVAMAGWWKRLFGAGPLERLYRIVGG